MRAKRGGLTDFVKDLDPLELAAIFAGGFAGALLRAALVSGIDAQRWPWQTFIANLAGTALLAWIVTASEARHGAFDYRMPLLGAGFCGALTTFSTFQLELLKLFQAGHDLLAFGYATASLLSGVALTVAVTLGQRRWRA